MNFWKITSIILFIILLSEITILIYNRYNPEYEFNKDFKINKLSLDNLIKFSGNPTKLCKKDVNYCLIIQRIE